MNGYIALDGQVYTWDTEPISPFTDEPTEQEMSDAIAAMSDEEVRARLEELLNEVSA